jgi:hypothetical protein
MRIVFTRSGAVVLVVCLAVLPVVAAGAQAAPTWRVARLGVPATVDLEGVSCLSADDCTAIGLGRVEYWRGVSWTSRSIVPGGLAISCLAGSCQTVGSTWIGADRLRGRSVTHERVQKPPDVTYLAVLDSVSCASASANTCVAVGSAGTDTQVGCPPNSIAYFCETASPLIERWNGRRWSIQPVPLPVVITPDVPVNSNGPGAALAGVSCASASACMAVGTWWQQASGPGYAFAELWNGKRWRLLTPAHSVSKAFAGVSCTSRDACTAVGWTAQQPRYVLVRRHTTPLIEHWNGRSWHVQRAPDPSPAHSAWLASVSCLGASCTAVGGAGPRPLIERGTREHWVPQHAPLPPHNHARGGSSLESVSCGTANACIAIGEYGNGDDSLVEQSR